MSYRKLKVWHLARELAIDIHNMTLELPKFEMYETGSQIRRSSKSTVSNLVEGYGPRSYKADYHKFITYSLSSNDETLSHLEMLSETGSLQDREKYRQLRAQTIFLGKKLNAFLQSVNNSFNRQVGFSSLQKNCRRSIWLRRQG